ncbi:unnamed protein product [Closterium sp. NIES-53]
MASSTAEAEIYARAMAAQELRWRVRLGGYGAHFDPLLNKSFCPNEASAPPGGIGHPSTARTPSHTTCLPPPPSSLHMAASPAGSSGRGEEGVEGGEPGGGLGDLAVQQQVAPVPRQLCPHAPPLQIRLHLRLHGGRHSAGRGEARGRGAESAG